MSQSRKKSSAAFAQQSQRLRSFRDLLDPTDLLPGHNVADLYSLRHLCLQGGGIPDTTSSSSDGWLRAQAWKVLLGYLTPEKSEWNRLLERRRAEYYQFVRDFLPNKGSTLQQGIPGKLSERDALLDQVYRDLSRSRKNAFAFYREEVKPSSSCPLAPMASSSSHQAEARISNRHSLLERLELINEDFAYSMQEERHLDSRPPRRRKKDGDSEENTEDIDEEIKDKGLPVPKDENYVEEASPSIFLQPASPQSMRASTPGASSVISEGDSYFASADEGDNDDDERIPKHSFIDRRWHSLLRILYIYALLNPSIGYVQGMNEVLFVLLYVMGSTSHLPSVRRAQEDHSRTSKGQDNGNGNGNGIGHPSDEMYPAIDADAASSFRYLDSLDEPPGLHAEADAFWCFSALVGDIRDLYDFDGVEHAGLTIINRRQAEGGSKQVTGMASALKKFSLRLKWLDESLWRQMRNNSLDPRLPYFSFRWLACMFSTELTLPSVVRVWDAILAESGGPMSGNNSEGSTPKIEFLIDFCCALLTNVRGSLLGSFDGSKVEDNDGTEEGEDSFGRAMKYLQAYPDDDVGPIVEVACLYRQKRLAAPLTGDGPPSEDEDDSNLSVRNRAANALRNWTSSSTPSRTSKWLSGSPRTPSVIDQSEVNTPSRTSSAQLFKRYTEAIQSSDAAANLSKASTNLTAKAMATWSANKVGKDGSQQISPLADIKQTLVNRVFSGTNASLGSSGEEGKQIHPSLRWSVQGIPPELPLPNVNDSPPHPYDSSSFAPSPTRGYTSVNRLGTASLIGHNENQLHSPDMSYADSTPGTSPTFNNVSKFGGMPITPRTKIRGAGPKPLLLTGSARPPREASANGSLSVDEVMMSRKVSSGPLAATSSPYNRRRRADNSSRRDSSYGGSVTSSLADRDSPSNDGMEESTSGKSESLHNLPSLQAVKDTLPPIPSSGLPIGLQGSGHGTGLGTVPASAFAKVRIASSGVDDRDETNRPSFGQVASSADVPLATKATLQRTPKRKDSELNGLASPIGDGLEATFSSTNRDSLTSSNSSRRFRRSSSTTMQSSLGTESFEHPRGVSTPSIVKEEEKLGAQRYTLTDEPSEPREGLPPNRSGSNSSSRSYKNRRPYSGGKRVRRSSSAQTTLQEPEMINDLVARGGIESLKLGSIKPDVPSLDVETRILDDSNAPELFSPKRQALEANKGRLLPSEELFSRLQLDQGYSGGESSGFEDEGIPPSLPKKEFLGTSSGLGPSHPSQKLSAEKLFHHNGLGFKKEEEEGQEDEHEGYTTEDMASIGNALAYADEVEED